MRYIFGLALLLILCSLNNIELFAGKTLDSLLTSRNEKYLEYSSFKDNMTNRSWSNLIQLGKKAQAVIDADNQLVTKYLQKELTKNKDLATSIEKLSLEMALLHKEAEVRGLLLREKQSQLKLFLIILASVSIALILSILFLIDRHKRYRIALREMENMWAMNDDTSNVNTVAGMLKERVNQLTFENNKFKKELIILSDQKKDAKNKLENEIHSRKVMEGEIKNLIGQIKNK